MKLRDIVLALAVFGAGASAGASCAKGGGTVSHDPAGDPARVGAPVWKDQVVAAATERQHEVVTFDGPP